MTAIALDVRVLAVLTAAICAHCQGLEVEPEDEALNAAAADLAGRIDHFFQHQAIGDEWDRCCEISGPLAASLQAARDASRLAEGEQDEDVVANLVTRAGWLQAQARDLAAELSTQVEVQSAEAAVA